MVIAFNNEGLGISSISRLLKIAKSTVLRIIEDRAKKISIPVVIETDQKYEFPYPKDLTYSKDQAQVIYMMYYMQGSFQNGRITGSWRPPKNGITTNTSILWPEAMSFFNTKIKEFDPEMIIDKLAEIR
jgi:hypothetical protein